MQHHAVFPKIAGQHDLSFLLQFLEYGPDQMVHPQGAAVRRFTDAETSLRHAAAMAESLNPYGVLARGYAMVEKDGAVSEVAALQPGDAITLRGAAVRADCVVQSVHKNAQGGMTL